MEPPPASTVTPVNGIMEKAARELPSSDNMKVVLKAQSPLLQKLFGGVVSGSDPRTLAELGLFVEMYREIFFPDSCGVVVVNSNGSVLAQCSCSSSILPRSVAFKVSLKMYRTELRKCFRYKGQSFQSFVTDEHLAAAHKDGVTKALSWLENQKNFQANNTNDISKESIKSSLEKEYRWLTEVNKERFRKLVDSSFKDELEDGAFLLKSSFCLESVAPAGFDIVPNLENHASISERLDKGIDKEIKSRVESFRKGIPGTINKNYVANMAATLSSRLEDRGSELKARNKEFVANFATSYMNQVADEYKGRIGSYLSNSNNININVTETEDTHQKFKGEALQKWESKILALDREFSTASQLVQLEGIIQQSFSGLWGKRREALIEQNLEEQRQRDVNEWIRRLQALGADDAVVKEFRASLPATLPRSPYEGMFRTAVESIKIGQQRRGVCGTPLECNSPNNTSTTTTTTAQTESTATQNNPRDDGIVVRMGQAGGGGANANLLPVRDSSQSDIYVVSQVNSANSSGRLEQLLSSAAPKLRFTKAAHQPKQARLENVPPTPTSTCKNHLPPPKSSSSSFDGGSSCNEDAGRKRKSARGVGKEP